MLDSLLENKVFVAAPARWANIEDGYWSGVLDSVRTQSRAH